MDTTTQPTITLPLRDYLDVLFTYKSNRDHILCRVATLSREQAEAIRQLDLEERFCHVEYHEDTPAVGQVWPIDDWRSHYIRREQLKAVSERSRKNKELLEEAKMRMVKTICDDEEIGVMFDIERATEYVGRIVREKKFAVAKKFGCPNLEELLQ